MIQTYLSYYKYCWRMQWRNERRTSFIWQLICWWQWLQQDMIDSSLCTSASNKALSCSRLTTWLFSLWSSVYKEQSTNNGKQSDPEYGCKDADCASFMNIVTIFVDCPNLWTSPQLFLSNVTLECPIMGAHNHQVHRGNITKVQRRGTLHKLPSR